ncbi:coenzyme F420-reducing hydrogenase beta subunit [Haloferula luteola]|uniref:Coenzyme F420-reducing hydrogenase beta subunit n=1 Tax=Haloferula luteola TaxID=595692 RepID=A0A840V5D4_9BACT|nr:Coenzyme F420 hydrogenase/dehydrogenase, beta subunit C-terminal domain [Haloferula luteola]MBB5350834.1 coenzyme F420-reducing hydrogenase beta subunit [Haloferula luteola]
MERRKKTIIDVVKGGYCVGCGGCAYAGGFEMKLNKYGEFLPDLSKYEELASDVPSKVCPFLNEELNEDRLSERFLDQSQHRSDKIGAYIGLYGGHVVESNFRDAGTSGGFGTWIGVELMRKGLIDGVIHVGSRERANQEGPFYGYTISLNQDEARAASRTKYHVIEFSEVLKLVKANQGKRYLFVGLPCFVKAIRRIQVYDHDMRNAIAYTASLVCGHLKSSNWSLSLGWGCGISPKNLVGIKYRTKGEGIPARAYVFTAYSQEREIVKDSAKVVGGKFNQGALMLNACNFCDDVVGETADITIGDAWLPRFEMDPDGNNMLVVRNADILGVILDAKAEGRVSLSELSEKEAIDAQAGGFRQRREGLSIRLEEADKKGIWRPEKRVLPGEYRVPGLRREIYRRRASISVVSREAFSDAVDDDDFSIYERRLGFHLRVLRFLEILSSLPRILRKKAAYLTLKFFPNRR